MHYNTTQVTTTVLAIYRCYVYFTPQTHSTEAEYRTQTAKYRAYVEDLWASIKADTFGYVMLFS